MILVVGLLLLDYKLPRDFCMGKMSVACGLLRKGGRLGLDQYLFLINLNYVILAEITPFYRSV